MGKETDTLRAPFPYFGGKSKIAPLVWKWLGDPKFYVEPFMGSAAVLLARPGGGDGRTEIVNDKDCLLVNFWRAAKFAPDDVAREAAHIHSQADMMARRRYVLDYIDDVRRWAKEDPDFCDAEIAGYWLYVQRMWIGDRCWDPEYADAGKTMKLCNGGKARSEEEWRAVLETLSARLLQVLVTCGDWKVALRGKWQTSSGADCGVFLDPPYDFERYAMTDAYEENQATVSREVEDWCRENGDRDGMRIVLCGYENEHDGLLERGWRKYEWQTDGGYAKNRRDENEVTLGLENSARERCWLSPNCLDCNGEAEDLPLLELMEGAR